jgi:hypothetical protein
MHWSVIYQALAAATLGQSLIIPSDITANGVYKVVTHDDGTEVHTKIADVGSNAFSTSAVDEHDVLKRSSAGQIWCGCGYNMNPGNCDAAVQELKNQLGNSKSKNLSLLWRTREKCSSTSQTLPFNSQLRRSSPGFLLHSI